MSGVLLVTVPTPVRTFNPNLGQLYLAASLRNTGIDVRLLDMASLYGSRDIDALLAAIIDQRPELVGFTLLTEGALYGYDLLAQLKKTVSLPVIAGGPHATSEPLEVLENGFDIVVLGEGEETLVELVVELRTGGNLSKVSGLAWFDEKGELKTSQPRSLLIDLDSLPSPLDVNDLYERERYVEQGRQILPPIITSRGCPGRCTFCSNDVSGTRYRFHSTERVISEVVRWQDCERAVSLFFQDTAFTADPSRALDLCKQLKNLETPISWVCKARCDQINEELAGAMKEAGCTSVFFGAESGSKAVLQQVGKGVTIDDIKSSVELAFNAGLFVYVHVMVGFPNETVEDLEATCNLMKQLAPFVKGFPTGGILLPYPGTAIYEAHHERLNCTRWWLNRELVDCINVPTRGPGSAMPSSVDEVLTVHATIEAAFLNAKVIPYSEPVKEAMERCLNVRRELNRAIMEGCSI